MSKLYAFMMLLVLIVAGVLASFFLTPEEMTVLWPVVTALALFIPALYLLSRRSGGVPFEDIGALYITVLLLYLTLPIVTYLMRGMVFTRYNDMRLYAFRPSLEDVTQVAWRGVVYG